MSPGSCLASSAGRWLAKSGLLVVSASLAIAVGELGFRVLDGYRLFRMELWREPGAQADELAVAVDYVRTMPVPASVDRNWFSKSPPRPPRRAVDPELMALYDALAGGTLAVDATKLWNACYVEAELRKRLPGGRFAEYPPSFSVLNPPEPTPYPRYRFPPDVTMPSGLVTNRFGFRGPQIGLNKPRRGIRIAFVGVSTTIDPHWHPYSYPELVGHWLEAWAAARRLNVIFEVINAGREGIDSRDIVGVVRQELLPLEPDLVVYYEGSNQFGFGHLLEMPEGQTPRSTSEVEKTGPRTWLQTHSAVARRMGVLIGALAPQAGGEAMKPPYRLRWPSGVDEFDPDLNRSDLPPQLSGVLRDLESMRNDLEGIGSELVVTSFIWLVDDGLALDPVRDTYLHRYLNETFWPFRYRDMRRMADFQNRVFKKYAAVHDLPFLDVATSFPLDPRLFVDAVHTRPSGTRLRAWVTLLQLLSVIDERIRTGILPRPDRIPLEHHPNLGPGRRIDWKGMLAAARAEGAGGRRDSGVCTLKTSRGVID